ncbi:MAG: hypothetical protein LBQ66_05720 [Planctomycetaceae bacterium]|nr:hypothetical protein [Planctomycetaceae bacterium]
MVRILKKMCGITRCPARVPVLAAFVANVVGCVDVWCVVNRYLVPFCGG